MGFNYGLEKRKFTEEWKKLYREYKAAGCKHSCRMRNPEREVGKSCFFLQIASQSHFSGAFEAENNENGCISALGLK